MTTHCLVIGRGEIKEILQTHAGLTVYGLNSFVRVDGKRSRGFGIPDFNGGEEEILIALEKFASPDLLMGLKHHLESFAKEKKVVLVDRFSITRFESLLSCVAEGVRGNSTAVIVIDPIAMRDTSEKARLYHLGADFVVDNDELLSAVTQLADAYGKSTKKEMAALRHAGRKVIILAVASAAIAGAISAVAKNMAEKIGKLPADTTAALLMTACLSSLAWLKIQQYYDKITK